MDSITNYKISTITATGSINTDVNLDIMYEKTIIHTDKCIEGALYAEFGNNKKGISKKANVNKRKTNISCKKFDNQLTLEYRVRMGDDFTILNCKIFKNGNIQMTGVKFLDQGRQFIDKLIVDIKHIYANNSEIIKDVSRLCNTNYMIRMINCDYKIGFNIKRDMLFKTMISEYDNMCSYEPCIYPGVKIQYMWNVNNRHNNGVCYCTSSCVNGKGNGLSDTNCKKITVAVFQSGCVIITGAQSKEQIDETYAWINKIIISNREKIEKKTIQTPLLNDVEVKKKIMIPKSKIISLRPSGCDQCF
uniref:TATA-box binding protein n=1 Tax=viral metagenome TaxID=1070528 RepID=A0A6C0BFW5_9ZZZZ